jgi:hypothetical protein
MFRPLSGGPPRARAARPRLVVEQLDDRLVPATFHVAPDGSNATGDGSAAGPYRTVQHAINQAALTPGPHAVKVAAGTYATAGVDLAVTVNDPDLAGLQLLGGWDRTTFSVRMPGSTVYVPQSAAAANTPDVDVRNPNVTIDGFTFVFDGTPGPGGTRPGGGVFSNASGLTLNQNTLEAGIRAGTATYAFRTGVTNQTGLRVTGNTILSNAGTAFTFATSGSGIFLSTDPGRTTPIVITGNTIAGPNLGSALVINDGCSNVTVSGNAISRTGTTVTGLPLIDVRQSTGAGPTQTGLVFDANTLDGGGATYRGIYLTGRGTGAQALNGVAVTGNVIRGVTFAVDASFPQVQAAGTLIRHNFIAELSTTGPASAPVVWSGTGTLDLAGNWWGTAIGPDPTDPTTPLAIDALGFGGTSTVRIGSFLTAGADADPVTPGFQVPAAAEVWVPRPDADMPARVRGSVAAGVAAATAGQTVRIASGTYAENVVTNKNLSLIGAGPTTVLAPAGGTGIALTAAGTAIIQDLRITGAGSALGVSGLTELSLVGVTLDGNGTGGTLTGIPTIHYRTASAADEVLTFETGAGADTISVVPSATTSFEVDGGSGEDTIAVEAGGQATSIDPDWAVVAGLLPVRLTGVERAAIPTQLGAVSFAHAVEDASLLTFPAGDQPAPGVAFSLVDAPPGATIDPFTGAFTWTPDEGLDPGSYPFTVRASANGTDADLAVTVVVSEGNQSPVLTGVPAGSAALTEGQAYSFTATASDADLPAQTVFTTVVGDLPAGAMFDANTGVFAWTPDETQGGTTHSFTVRVTDGAKTTDQIVTLEVAEVNEAPVLVGVPAAIVVLDEGMPFTFTASATDPDAPAQTLTLSVVGSLPDGAAFDPATGEFTWVPGEAAGGRTFTLAVQVSDGDRTDTRPVTIRVVELNETPALTPLPDSVSVVRGDVIRLTAVASDPDLGTGGEGELRYDLLRAPAAAAIDPESGAFTWDTASARPGTYVFDVRVSDGGTPALSSTQQVTVRVDTAALTAGTLRVGGTLAADRIWVVRGPADTLVVRVNGIIEGKFPVAELTGRIVVDGLAGNDLLWVGEGVRVGADLRGGAGRDMLVGGAGDDLLDGGAGRDTLSGGPGNDTLLGGADRDLFFVDGGLDLTDWSPAEDAGPPRYRRRVR